MTDDLDAPKQTCPGLRRRSPPPGAVFFLPLSSKIRSDAREPGVIRSVCAHDLSGTFGQRFIQQLVHLPICFFRDLTLVPRHLLLLF